LHRTDLRISPTLLLLALAACSSAGTDSEPPVCLSPAEVAAERVVEPPPPPACENDALLGHDALLVLAPHPDDEVLGFAGLIDAFLQRGKPVEIVVVTDGDAYCEACRFWKSGSVTGPTCTAEELSNLATPEVDSFAEVRREESRRAMAVLGAPEPTFLGAPDIGLRITWARVSEGDAGELEEPLRRSDFSGCTDCETCASGWAEGPDSGLTAGGLVDELAARLAALPPGALVATTHPLDRHRDHAGLGNLVRETNTALPRPRIVAYAVIHAHTNKDLAFPECWYPAPRAIQCGCAVESCAAEDPDWIAALRAHRDRPDWPAMLPDDADYGEPTQLCLRDAAWKGPQARKRQAIEAHASQLGNALRDGEPPPHLRGILDCSGYLGAFVRSTEVFVVNGH
jgi:LmbE family N-acetylglucosaminyl deacetylase